jgi:hypothetical protein
MRVSRVIRVKYHKPFRGANFVGLLGLIGIIRVFRVIRVIRVMVG